MFALIAALTSFALAASALTLVGMMLLDSGTKILSALAGTPPSAAILRLPPRQPRQVLPVRGLACVPLRVAA